MSCHETKASLHGMKTWTIRCVYSSIRAARNHLIEMHVPDRSCAHRASQYPDSWVHAKLPSSTCISLLIKKKWYNHFHFPRFWGPALQPVGVKSLRPLIAIIGGKSNSTRISFSWQNNIKIFIAYLQCMHVDTDFASFKTKSYIKKVTTSNSSLCCCWSQWVVSNKLE